MQLSDTHIGGADCSSLSQELRYDFCSLSENNNPSMCRKTEWNSIINIIIIIALDNAPYKMLDKLKSSCSIRKKQL